MIELIDELQQACAQYLDLPNRIVLLMRGAGVRAITVGDQHFELTNRHNLNVTRQPLSAGAPNPQKELPL